MAHDNAPLSKIFDVVTGLVAISFSGFQMYTAFAGTFPETVQRSVHLCFALVLIFWMYDFKGRKCRRFSVTGTLFAVCSIVATVYIVYFFNDLVFRQARINNVDAVIGWVITLAVIETTRRMIGWPLVIVSLISIAYAYLGDLLPASVAHPGLSLVAISDRFAMDVAASLGIFGLTLGVSTTYVFIFVLFGAFFKETGGTAFIMDFSKAIIGRLTGGSAKLSVISSGMFGSISGSASANVTVTGTMTIPLMIRTGFPPNFAAAVEATASSGGLIMPPIMGAVGFIIAEVLGVDYVEVVKAAFLPAMVYFISLFFAVDLYARKLRLPKLPAEEIPTIMEVVKKRWLSIIPIILLIYLLVILRLSPGLSAFWSIVSMVVLDSILKFREGIEGVKKAFYGTLNSFRKGAETALLVVVTLAVVGIPMCVIATTGIGIKFGSVLIQLGGDNLFLILLLAMIACIILGTGLEAAAAYIMISIVLVPILSKLGIPAMTSHLFIFYFGVLSNVTPPVAITSYVASGLAKDSKAFSTAIIGFRLSMAGFLIPFMLIYREELMMRGEIMGVVYAFLVLVLGCYTFQAASVGYLFGETNAFLRVLLFLCSILLIFPHRVLDFVGFALIGILFLLQFLLIKRQGWSKRAKIFSARQ
jgi:TRAP transporter 4TM/12TM fusion protein